MNIDGKFRSHQQILFALIVTLFLFQAGAAGAESYVKFIAGFGDLDDGGDLQVDDPRFAESTDSSYSFGFRAGVAYGWRFSERWALEFEYLYSTNDLDEVIFADGRRFDEGNYASVVISANAYRYFRQNQRLRPYIGAGLGWVQEVDIDFEENGEEISFETDDFGFQVMGGLLYELNERLDLDIQARWLSVSSLTMEAEEGSGQARADYEPLSLLIGLSYRF